MLLFLLACVEAVEPAEDSWDSASCFVRGTSVAVPGAAQPIESLRVGDTVLSTWDGRPVAARVTGLAVHEGGALLTLHAPGVRLTTTPEHPVYSAATGSWRPASDFAVGDLLLGLEGPVRVHGVERGWTSERLYDLEVAGPESFFAEGVLVHNKTVDVDGDGYSPPEDCDEQDVSIHPGANEDCSNGVDDDCDQLIDETDADCWD